jgi:polyketide biosynthesis enoyl-CoA hydratase PksI
MTESVIESTEVAPGVRLITMCDRTHKNAFTPELVEGLVSAFDAVKQEPSCHAVVLTGYDSYFSTGGTQNGLLAIHEGRSRFTDLNLYSLALECEVPVITAMQGHAIGGGLALGLYADIVILSRESVYTSNFMRYGFTPGMGATYLLPAKLGLSLAHEMLLNAATYRGSDLACRGVPFPVLPRAQVLPRALQIAAELAEKPVTALRQLKAHLVRPIREALPAVIEQELAMHELTFHSGDVKARLASQYGS